MGMATLRGWRSWPESFGRITTTHSYVAQIDGLRFLAVMQVLLYHAALRGQRAADPAAHPADGWFGWWPNGIAGVELFFFISGYIIAIPFLSGKATDLRAFYLRRITRLEPPYILTVLLCFAAFAVMSGAVGPAPAAMQHGGGEPTPIWANLAASLLYLHGTFFQASPRFNPPLWTLEIEIQFYLIAPFLIAALLKVRRFRHRMILAAGSIMLAIAVQAAFEPHARWHYSLITHLYPFLLGIAASDWALRNRPFEREPGHAGDVALAVGLALLLAGSMLYYAGLDRIQTMALLAVRVVAIVLIYLGAAQGRLGRRVLGNRWIAWIGGACYSIYLLHVPLLQIGARVLLAPFDLTGQPALAVALVMALIVPLVLVGSIAFYIAIERPCMASEWPRRLIHQWANGRGTAA